MPQTNILDTVLLLALPASGKSEVRKYMASLTPEQCRDDFHMGPTVQLDDFPAVHLMRRIDEEVGKRGGKRLFFASPDKPFLDPRDWGTLIHLINEDYADLQTHRQHHPKSASLDWFERIDRAGKKAGIPERLSTLDSTVRSGAADALEKECLELLKEKNENSAIDLKGKTIVIEFARGGKHGSSCPLSAPFGYQYSLGQLSEQILSKARILYVWVTPEESRRKNQERTDPNDPGSILHHGVPIDVMMNDYGCDDMEYLEKNSKTPGTVTVKASGKDFVLPIARFDNRVDKTSFIRKDRAAWGAGEVHAIHQGLGGALTQLSKF